MAAMDADAFYNLMDDDATGSTPSQPFAPPLAPPPRVMMPVLRSFPVYVPHNAAPGHILNITCPSGCQIQVPRRHAPRPARSALLPFLGDITTNEAQ